MKIKRFAAKTMREAIRLVRDEQGPDAVILSNRRINGGVEVVAATDYDAALMQQAVRIAAAEQAAAQAAVQVAAQAAATAVRRPPAAMPPTRPASSVAPAQLHHPAKPTLATSVAKPVPTAAAALAASAPQREFKALREELGGMRRLIEEQMAGLVWRDLKDRSPERMGALRAMASLALDPSLTREILAELPEQPGAERARFLPLGLLARRIHCTKEDPILDGGIVALIGPTGAGKTTTVAKLAARYAARHSVRDIALVTTDSFRVGAQEQLHTYGRMLGVPVHCAASADELSAVLAKLADHKLVLIDTAGMAPRDQKLATQFSMLAGARVPIRSYVVLSATTQAGDLDEIVRRFSAAKPLGCVISKLDEATRIGGVLSTVIRKNLPVAYLADGQRVPEDLKVARADHLVLRAMQLSRLTPAVPDDTTLALQFGATRAHL